MGHKHTNGDQSSITINVTMPCGCCHFEVGFFPSGDVNVKSKGLSEKQLLSKLDDLTAALPESLQALVTASKTRDFNKKTVQ